MKEAGQMETMKKLETVGFYPITQLKIKKIHSEFMMWFYEKFHPSQLKVQLEGRKFLYICENDVKRVYKLPMGPRSIASAKSTKEDIDALRGEHL
ncbi:hypothetical protein LIER_40002 [Lithospermum erythrorhizon]|uniref:Uncharacterized protein n=1 Tax=Lithospermum erythrorhizon TaxID=34254 RepID=A0AAV3QRF0_LITER